MLIPAWNGKERGVGIFVGILNGRASTPSGFGIDPKIVNSARRGNSRYHFPYGVGHGGFKTPEPSHSLTGDEWGIPTNFKVTIPPGIASPVQ